MIIGYIEICGYGLSALLFKQIKHKFIAALFIGYIITQLLFGLSILFVKSYSIALVISFIPFSLTVITAFSERNYFSTISLKKISWYYLLVHFILVFFILFQTAWPLFLSNPIENYWHTGALDLVQDVFMQSIQIFKTGEYSSDFVVNHLLQYTSPAYWFIFFNTPSVSIILIQYLVLIVLMYIGIYMFSREILFFSPYEATLAGILSTTSAFYSATFTNYHGGTMMFLAIIFFALWLAMQDKSIFNKEEYRFVFLFLICIYLLLVYNYAILYFYSFGLLFLTRIGKRITNTKFSLFSISVAFLSILVIGFLGIYIVTHFSNFYLINKDFMAMDYQGYRVWEVIRSPLLPLFYFGLMPQLLMGVGYPYLPEIYLDKYLLFFLFGLAVYILIQMLFGVFKISRKYYYFRFFFMNMAAFFPVFFMFLDPYYTYKLLYTTQPLFIMALIYKFKNIS